MYWLLTEKELFPELAETGKLPILIKNIEDTDGNLKTHFCNGFEHLHNVIARKVFYILENTPFESELAEDLFEGMLNKNPKHRVTAEDIIQSISERHYTGYMSEGSDDDT
ncbi:hypothetical protein EOPP23_19570 [Endozoicomonas sp. OPT23]|uniref:hypothetical protein n=1 Tax=Endozoicomonas sp. OPT23 TaxID=2072845 RepID=UPI00129A9658|nr:hypothetical protein [Endozoicomonas sp. OPT23]MRI35170.1 hypothetical protein [Endozoicomonas sp. OPT23]